MDNFIGEIRLFAGDYAPQGWAICDGSLLPISPNQALFSLLGTTYGGNGVNDFGLPDLRGRVPLHMGQGPGLTNRILGTKAGVEQVTLGQPQIPAHTHALNANSNPTSRSSVAAGQMIADVGSGNSLYELAQDFNNPVTGPPTMIGNTGGNQPHDNLMPYVSVSFIIATEGIYPSQN